jgi:6,7-dimethyl-8-ribityllumazine synthase
MAEPRRSATEIEGDVTGARVLVVEARFYEDISDALWAGARRALDEAAVTYDRVIVRSMPPPAARAPMTVSSRSDA